MRPVSVPLPFRLVALALAVVPVVVFASGIDAFVTAFQRYFEPRQTPFTVYTDVGALRDETWRQPLEEARKAEAEKAEAEKAAAEKAAAGPAATAPEPQQPAR